MKKRLFFGSMILLLGALIALLPHTIFPVCSGTIETAAGSTVPMKCHWTAQAELGVGGLIAFGGLLLLLLPSLQAKKAVALMTAASAVLAAAIPTVLIGVCKMETMGCRMLTLPALLVLSGFVAVACLIYAWQLHRQISVAKDEDQ